MGTQTKLEWYDELLGEKDQVRNPVESDKKIYQKLAKQRKRTPAEQVKFDLVFDPARRDWAGTDDWWKRDKEKYYR